MGDIVLKDLDGANVTTKVLRRERGRGVRRCDLGSLGLRHTLAHAHTDTYRLRSEDPTLQTLEMRGRALDKECREPPEAG